MAQAKLNLFSDSLGTPQSVNLILPQPEQMRDSAVLYLLHGLLDNEDSWLQRTRLVEYAEKYALIIVMPNAQRSFYADQTHGFRWFHWISTELPNAIEQWLNLAEGFNNRHIAGLSMGGYGAMKTGLTSAERFHSIGSFSGVLDLIGVEQTKSFEMVRHDLDLCFGGLENVAESANDLFYLLDSTQPPNLFISCGMDDDLLPGNQRFVQHLEDRGTDYSYHEQPGGHEWSLWDNDIERYLQWLHKQGWLKLM